MCVEPPLFWVHTWFGCICSTAAVLIKCLINDEPLDKGGSTTRALSEAWRIEIDSGYESFESNNKFVANFVTNRLH